MFDVSYSVHKEAVLLVLLCEYRTLARVSHVVV